MNWNEAITRMKLVVDESPPLPVELDQQCEELYSDIDETAKLILAGISWWYARGVDILPIIAEKVRAAETHVKNSRYAER